MCGCGWRQPTGSAGRASARARRAFSLVEVLVVVAMLGVIAALAVPNLLPMTQQVRLQGDVARIAAFLEAVRARTLSEQRCYMVTVSGRTVFASRRSSPDCVNLGADSWASNVLSTSVDAGATLSLGATDALPAGLPADQRMIFRPNGRLRGDGDLDPTEEIARIVVGQSGIADKGVVLVSSFLRICTLPATATVPTLTTSLGCP
ncbi:MAG: type II secretion system protein [Deltaproteobacteria bacterium]|nr:type II secretion system protein [Deltaproteobacteria bacterium]